MTTQGKRRRRRPRPCRALGGTTALALALLAGPAAAQPTVSTASSFDPAEAGRTYMDVGGAWDGSTDVSLTGAGDGFSATLSNAAGSPEAAADLRLFIDLPTGFLHQTANPVAATLSGPGCGSTPTVSVSDNGGSLDVDFDAAGGAEAYDLPADCAIELDFELLADIDANAGTNAVDFEWRYDDAGGVARTEPHTQTVDVRAGAPALAVDPLSQTSTGTGDTATWQVTVTNQATGGLFAVEIDETAINGNPSVGLQLNPPVTVAGAPRAVNINGAGDIATIPYLDAGESFTIDVSAEVESCNNLNNEVQSRHKVSVDDPDEPGDQSFQSVIAEVLLDLQNPQLDYTPLSGDLDYSGPTTFDIPVTNNGTGTAFDVTLDTNLDSPGGPAVNVVSTSGGWTYAGGGTFVLQADLGAGAGNLPAGDSTTLTVELEPADVCTDGGGGTIEYTPDYENVCGTTFGSPTDTGGLGGAQPVPATGVAKASSLAQLGIGSGDTASYDVDLSAAETDLIQDGSFTVTDTLPAALGGPIGTSATAGSVACPGGSCDPGEQVTWTVPNPGDGSAVSETLTIDFTAPDDACLGGTTLTNTASIQPATSTQTCTVDGDSGSAGILLANVPDPEDSDAFSFTVTGGPFETGLPDDGDCSQATGEGECIPHQAAYQFPAGFPGVWESSDGESSEFTDDFGGVAQQELVPGTAEVEAFENGASLGTTAVPPGSILQSSGQLVLDLAFLEGVYGDPGVATTADEREIRIRYATTVPDAALGGAAETTIGATSELLIRGSAAGEGACPIGTEDAIFTVPTSFTVQRASAEVSVSRTDGATTADVCEVMPVRLDVQNGNGQQAADLLTQLATGGSDYTHLDPPAPVYGGQFGSSFLDYTAGAAGGPTWEFDDPEAELTGGTIDTRVRLEPGAPTGFGAGTPLTANVDYDDNETTLSPPVGGSATPGRAFSTSGGFTPTEVRQGDLTIQTTPQQRFVTGSQVGWTIFVVNGGSGAAYNVRVENDLADALNLNIAASNAATPACGGRSWTLTNPSGDLMRWEIPSVPDATTCRIEVVADVPTTTGCSIPNDGPESNRIAGQWGCGGQFVQQGDLGGPYTHPLADDSPDFVFAEPELRLRHEVSFCNLCDPTTPGGGSGSFDPNDGTVRLQVRNNGASRIQNLEVVEELPTTNGIDLVAGTVEYSVDGGSTWNATSDPAPAGTGQYRFTEAQIPEFAELVTPSEEDIGAGQIAEVLIRYNISSDEGTRPGPHPIVVSGEGERPCDGEIFDFGPRQDLIEVREPDITVTKTGDNLDRANDGTPEQVVGLPGERIQWTIEIANNGEHNTRQTRLRDVLLDAVGSIVANRTTSSGDDDTLVLDSTALPGPITLNDTGGGFPEEEDYVELPTIPPGNTVTYTLTETLGGNCFNADNRADLTWGCQDNAQGTASGLDLPGDPDDTARLLMVPDFSADDAIQQSFAPLPGGRTEVTLTLRNDGAPAQDMVVENDLPAGLRIDESAPTIVVSSTASPPQTVANVDTTSGSPGDPGSPNHPRIELDDPLGFGETTTIRFQAIQTTNFDGTDDPFTDPEQNPGADPDPPADGDNVVRVDFAQTAACEVFSPPTPEDAENLDPSTPDVDFDAGGPAAPRVVADGETETFTFTIENEGEGGSIAAPVEFRLDELGGGWDPGTVSVAVTSSQGSGGACASSPPYTCTAGQIGQLQQGDQAVIEVTATARDNGSPLTLIAAVEGSVVEAGGTDVDDFSFDRKRAIVAGFELSKALDATSEGYTSDPEVAVGEDADFDLRARWFGLDTDEAVRSITVRDRLDPGSDRLGFVQNSDSVADGGSISSVNTPPTAISGTIEWTLADVTGAGAATLTSDLTTRLLNTSAVDGDTVTNALDATFNLDYTGGPDFTFASDEFGGNDSELAAGSDLTVVEPGITFDKEVRNVTRGSGFQPGDDDTTAVDAEGGDSVEYRVTLGNTGNAPVFGLIVDDQFVTENIVLDPASAGIDTDGDGNVDVNCGDVTANTGAPPDRAVFDSDECSFGSPGNNLVRLDPGNTITILYRGEVQITVAPEETADNGAELTDAWSLADPDGDRSHQGDQTAGFEGTKGDDDGARNHPGSDLGRVIIENETQIAKTVTATTSPLGDGGDGEPDLRVGDGLTYEVVVDLAPASTIDNFTVSDALPPGFEFTGDVSTFSFTDFSPSNPNPADPAAGDTTHTWGFGTVTVTDTDGDGATTPELRFTYDVETLDTDPDGGPNEVDIPPADSSLDEENAATVAFDTGGTDDFSATAIAPVDIPQPLMSAAKTANTPDPPPGRAGENDTVTYTVTIDNPSQGTAYDPVVEDVVPDGMRGGGVAGISTTSITVGGASLAACAPVDPGGDFATTGDVRWILDGNTGACTDDYTIGPGEQLEIVYAIQVNDDIGPDVPLPNAARAVEWFSFDDDAVPGVPGATTVPERREYGPTNTATEDLRSDLPGIPSKANPAPPEATIGEALTYTIRVPADPSALDVSVFDTVITDDLPAPVSCVSVTDTTPGGASGNVQHNCGSVAPGGSLVIEDPTGGIDIAPGEFASFDVTVRVNNTVDEDAGDTFTNTVRYDYSSTDDDGDSENDGGSATPGDVTILEPLIEPSKQARNVTAGDSFGGGAPTAPDAGDTIEYCLGFTEDRGAAASDAHDLEIADTLPPDTQLVTGSTQLADGACAPGNPQGNTLGAPGVSGQTLTWDASDPANDVDVAAGTTVSVLYRVELQESLAPASTLTNAAAVEWSSLDGPDTNERTGASAPAEPDDYRATTDTTFTSADSTVVAKTETSTPPLGNGGDGDGDYRLGELVEYTIEITDLTEGTLDDFVISDTLPEGLVFNGATITQGGGLTPDPTGTGVTIVSGDGSPGNPQTIEWDFGDVVNTGEAPNGTNDTLTIEYSAMVRNDAPATEDAANDATVSYLDGDGDPVDRPASTTIDIVVPTFNAPLKSTTVPTAPGGTVDAGTTVPYTLELTNTGGAPAYDVVVEDTIPAGMRDAVAASGTLPATLEITDAGGTTVDGPRTVNATFPGTFTSDGRVRWAIDTGGDDDIVPAGGTLTLQYDVDIDADVGPGVLMTNAAGGLEWFTIDPDAPPAEGTPVQRGPGPTDDVSVQTPTPGPLSKASTTDASTMGDEIVYRLRVPDASFGAQLYDVAVTDTLPANVELLSVDYAPTSDVSEPLAASVSGGNVLTITSSSDPDGIDIPAGDVAVIDVTVRHNDAGGGVAGDTYANGADYTWERAENGTDDLDAGPPSSHTIDVVEPDLVVNKSGPATLGRAGASFTVTAENVGRADAYDAVLTDVLPAEMRDTQPVIDNVEIGGPGGARALAAGTDYTVSWSGTSGTLELMLESGDAAIAGAGITGAGETLTVEYTAFPDGDAADGAALTNVAGATRYATQDGTGGGFPPDTRVYTQPLSNGTPGTADHEDEHTTTVEAPILEVDKAVDLSTANPGDTLTYSITVSNSGTGDARVDITDDLGALDGDDVYLPGTLGITSPPATFGTNATDPGGGTGGKGLIDFRDVVVPAGGSASLEATIDTRPVVSDGDLAINQGSVTDRFFEVTEPTDDPATMDDDDPTETVFGAQPELAVTKRDADLTGDAGVLALGDTIEYTIEVENVGTETVTGAVLTDTIPGNTSYVPGSTTLNGSAVPDAGSGSDPRSALEDGLAINDPGSPAGTITAQSGNTATITFRVTVDGDLLEGTVISNQGVVTAEGTGSGVVPTVPSDDPDTPIADDPTQTIVGAAPLIDVQKTVSANEDPVQSGSTQLSYTITISNNGTAPATRAVLTDDVPADTTYVAGSTTLNSVAVPDGAGGVSPLSSGTGGLPVSSSDLVPPGALPGVADATLNPGESAIVVFRVTVDGGVPSGTVISNQGSLASEQQPDEPTDADGNDENGDQPTTVIVGGEPRLKVSKEVFVVGGGTIQPGGLLDYAVRVENTGPVDVTDVEITDDLDAPVAGQLDYIPGSGRLDGVAAPVTFTDPVVRASAGTLAPGEATELRFRARVNASLAQGTTIENTGEVTADGGVSRSGTVTIDVGGAPGVANLTGRVWLDNDLDDTFDSGSERPLDDWRVAVEFNGNTIGTVGSATDGTYALRGLAPGGEYGLQFTFPGQTTTFGETVATLGTPGRQVITAIDPVAGANVTGESMPVTANGVVYDSIERTPVGNVELNLLDTATGAPVAAGCFADSTQQGQQTASNGLYLFELQFSDPSCPDPGDYLIELTPPGGAGAPSQIIPPVTDGTTAPYQVPACSDDAIAPSPPGGLCQAQAQDTPPGTSVSPGAGTRHYLNMQLAGSGNADAVYNHHLPVDPELDESITLTKTTPLKNVVRGQLVPYTITANNQLGGPLSDTTILDMIPPGFKYVEGSATVEGQKEEPAVDGRELAWRDLTLPSGETFEIKLILIVGSGVGEGEYTNRARARNSAIGASASREASAAVRVVPDPTFDCTDVIGKVFEDRDADGHQDEGEPGMGGVRVTTPRGLLITTDRHGRYHVTCAAVPERDRGSNIVLKLDPRSLPSGYRVTSENPRVVRATRGKMVRVNFGATVHRVVRLDLAGAAFVPAKAALRPEWSDRLEPLFAQLDEGPSILRISYLGDTESSGLAQRRLEAIRERVETRWSGRDGAYDLRIETEVYWRRGRPGGSQ